MTPMLAIRIGLGWLTLIALQLGVWALLAPRSFYDDFPGLGRTWVAVDGPYNEHLVRDVGALNLAIAFVLIAAIMRPTRDRVMIAAAASLIWGVPHLLYHLSNTADLGTGDVIASVGGLAVSVAFAATLIVVSRRPETT